VDFPPQGFAPRVLGTYGLVYACTALLLAPALFLIDTLSIDVFTPAYLALIVGPFVLGPAVVFATDSRDDARTLAIRSAVLAPLVALTGVTLLFLAMMLIVIPLSVFLVPENFAVMTVLSAITVIILAAPMAFSFISTIRQGFSARGLVHLAVLATVMVIVGWVVVMTLDSGDTLGTFMRRDMVGHFAGAFTWYLPSFSLAAGVWRQTGIA